MNTPPANQASHGQPVAADATTPRYVGFWARTLAAIVDTVLTFAIVFPLLLAIYGHPYLEDETRRGFSGAADVLITWILPALASIGFWLWRQATPGKMAIAAKVVDARTGGPMSGAQAAGRYLAYFVSIAPLGLGLLWVALDPRKQGWHDKLAGTVVVRR